MGHDSLADALEPAIGVARDGFVVDQTFSSQVAENLAPFGQFSSTSALYLPGGAPPAVGSVLRNPDLASTYSQIARAGVKTFYRGDIARDIVQTVQDPPFARDPIGAWANPVRPGGMQLSDLMRYNVKFPKPTQIDYRGLQVYGMAPPSSGGSTVGEALNILETFDLSGMSREQALHHYLEASALAFADRNRYVGDDTSARILRELLADDFAAERACLIDPARRSPSRWRRASLTAPAAHAIRWPPPPPSMRECPRRT